MFDPKEALKSGIYIGGGKGSGKTTTAHKLIDILMKNGVIVYIFDNSQAWLDRSTVPYYIKINKIPFSIDFTIDKSIVFDISELYVEEQQLVVAEFCKQLFTTQVKLPKEKRKWVYIILEEAQTYIPEGSMRSKAAREIKRLITVGRNFCIGFGLITQFPSTVDKLSIKATNQKYFGRTSEPNDISYISGFLGKEYSEKLSSLNVGQFIYSNAGKMDITQFEYFESKTPPTQLNIVKTGSVQPESGLGFLGTPKTEEEDLSNNDKAKALVLIFFGALLIFLILWAILP